MIVITNVTRDMDRVTVMAYDTEKQEKLGINMDEHDFWTALVEHSNKNALIAVVAGE